MIWSMAYVTKEQEIGTVKNTYRPDVCDFSLEELKAFVEEIGEPSYRARQLFTWIYQKGVYRPNFMTDFPKPFRERLEGELNFDLNEPETTRTSKDGTKKYLFRLKDCLTIESVLIPQGDHLTLCISTQVGCAQGCAFCFTGGMGFKRNLTSGEILNQFLAVRAGLEKGRNLSNVVLMGMGEPLANYGQTLKALHIMAGQEGLQVGRRRITLSTVGLVPMIRRLGREMPVNLAISLNAPDDETRSELMPVNKKYPLQELLNVCREFPLQRGRRITFEYILIGGVNDRPEQAQKLAALLRGHKAKINIIPYNEHPGSPFISPSQEDVRKFQEILIRNHYTAIIRKSKGSDIFAACGQLAAHGYK